MKLLRQFLLTNKEEILMFGIAIPLVLWALTTGDLTLIIGVVGGVVLAVILIYVIADRIAQRRRAGKEVGENTALKVPRRGIIFTVGLQVSTLKFALERQRPEYIGLICSKESLDYANAIAEELNQNVERARVRMVDPFDLREIRSVTQQLLGWMLERGLKKSEVVIDVTGALTTMSLGAFSFAKDEQIDSQYIRSKYDKRENSVIIGTQDGIFVERYSGIPLSEQPIVAREPAPSVNKP